MQQKKEQRVSVSYVTGVIALVFLVIGYQTALFVHKAAVAKIVSNRDEPDTVYIVKHVAGAEGSPGVNKDAENVKKTGGGHAVSGSGNKDMMIRKEAEHSPQARQIAAAYREVRSFRFDPNTVSVEDLQLLGFSLKQARAIDNYRKKGGRFRRRSDFAKSFVVSDSIYRRLEPFIEIPLLDLNLADSAAFDTLPGIGGYFAARMVDYRAALGGSYSYKEQLLDIYKFDQVKYDGLKDLITVSQEHARPYPLWTFPEDSLRLHPYIGSYASHGIVVYRENNPKEAWTVEALAAAGILKPSMAEKLSKCMIARP